MQLDQLRRREVITLLGGAAAWPLASRAQERERVRRIGVLIGSALVDADDLDGRARVDAFRQALQQLGWADGRNVNIDYRWSGGGAGPNSRPCSSGCAVRH
jgi:putative ABC transport system substrate-binding protein